MNSQRYYFKKYFANDLLAKLCFYIIFAEVNELIEKKKN